jgi:hypothetical protein
MFKMHAFTQVSGMVFICVYPSRRRSAAKRRFSTT